MKQVTPFRLSGFVAGVLLCTAGTGLLKAFDLFANVSATLGERAIMFSAFAFAPVLLLFLAFKYFVGPPRRWVHSAAFVILALYALSVGARILSVLRVGSVRQPAVMLSLRGMLVDLAVILLLIFVVAIIRRSSSEGMTPDHGNGNLRP